MLSFETVLDNVMQVIAGTKRLAVVQSTMRSGDVVYEVRLRKTGYMSPEPGSADAVREAILAVKERFNIDRARLIIQSTGAKTSPTF